MTAQYLLNSIKLPNCFIDNSITPGSDYAEFFDSRYFDKEN